MNITVTAGTVAWYGAILSTVVFLFEIYKFWKDRPALKITYRTNQQVVADDGTGNFVDTEKGTTFWTVAVSNTGAKDVIVTQVGVEWKGKSGGAVLTKDYSGHVQRFTLVPGDSRTFTISEKLINHTKVKKFWAKDATGKEYKKRINWL